MHPKYYTHAGDPVISPTGLIIREEEIRNKNVCVFLFWNTNQTHPKHYTHACDPVISATGLLMT